MPIGSHHSMIKMFRFLQFLLRGARTMMVLMVFTGLLAGLSSVGLLAVINKLINGAGATSQIFAVAFIGLAVLKVLSNYLSQLLLVTFAQETILNLGMELCWKIVRAPYRTLERRGAHEILATRYLRGIGYPQGSGGLAVPQLGDDQAVPGH